MLNDRNSRADRVLQKRFERRQETPKTPRTKWITPLGSRMWGKDGGIVYVDDIDGEPVSIEERERRKARIAEARMERLARESAARAARQAAEEEERKRKDAEYQARRAARLKKKAEERDAKKLAMVARQWSSEIEEDAW